MNGHHALELPSHDLLARLARDDPKAYEALRQELVDGFIASAPAHIRQRLRGVQFRVECVRRLSRSALGSTTKTYEMMWASFLGLDGNLQELAQLKQGYIAARSASPASARRAALRARVLDFRPRTARAAEATANQARAGATPALNGSSDNRTPDKADNHELIDTR